MIAIREYEGQQIRERSDGYFSLTDIAKAAGKQFAHWRELDGTDAFLKALAPVIGIPITELIQIQQGGWPNQQGSWGHPQVAMHVALWASPKLQVVVTGWMLERLTGANPAASQRLYVDEQLRLYHPDSTPKDLVRMHEFLISVVAEERGVEVGNDGGRAYLNAADSWVFWRAREHAARMQAISGQGSTLRLRPLPPPPADTPADFDPDAYREDQEREAIRTAPNFTARKRFAVELLRRQGGEAKLSDLAKYRPNWGSVVQSEVLRSLQADGVIEERVVQSNMKGRPPRVYRLLLK